MMSKWSNLNPNGDILTTYWDGPVFTMPGERGIGVIDIVIYGNTSQ